MDDSLSRVVSGLFFAGFVMVIVAVFLLFASFDLDSTIKADTIKFHNSCASTGSIDPAKYYTYANNISKMGNYQIIITHDSENYYAEGNSYKKDHLSYGTDEILSYMYPDSGENNTWKMKNGDMLTIKVVKKNSDLTALWNAIMHGGAPQVIAEASGYVGQD